MNRRYFTNRRGKSMKHSNGWIRIAGFLTIALLGLFSTDLQAAVAQKTFASPEDAIKALQAATATKDQAALDEIFGPGFRELMTGDKVQDANNEEKFAAAMAQSCKPVNEGDDKVTLVIGTNDWPMAIPLVKADGQWHFDTAAGKEEIINRHIGKDELCAIGVCRAYVTAQKEFASLNTDANGGVKYALKFKSTPGKKDGLYWPAAGESTSPFGPLVAEAHAEGYVGHKSGGPHPFHGYYFRDPDPRKARRRTGGENGLYEPRQVDWGDSALVAYPEHWDQSGIMTVIVTQDGKVYQRNLAEKTSQVAVAMKAYNPDSGWTLVPDEGVANIVTSEMYAG